MAQLMSTRQEKRCFCSAGSQELAKFAVDEAKTEKHIKVL
jgi:hypothetical protein